MSSRRLQTKRIITDLLRDSTPAQLSGNLLAWPAREVINPLFSCLCHPEELVRWRAVTGFGVIVPTIADQDLEEARVLIRRFLWMLNDESGGIGWGVPQALAEVLAGSALLAREYLHMLVSYTLDDGPELFQHGNFLENEILQEGVLWGICRVAPLYPDQLLELGMATNCGGYFSSARSAIRGLACRLSGLLDLARYRTQLLGLTGDQAELRLYEAAVMHDCRVMDLAREALRGLGEDQRSGSPGGNGATGSPPRQ
ncbi:MAG: HEAT repeat domain-containing protein [Desulfofustis sp.]|nr:HEAT repeat domain-containing protein [Desulfofustis sp.]